MADIVGKEGCCVLLALALITGQAAGEDRREKLTAENLLPPAALEEYRSKLKAYLAARQNFDQEARAYWTSVAERKAVRNEKRRKKLALLLDDYVLTQPPVYRGPAKPVDPAAAELPPPAPKYIPVIADFLASAEAYFHFTPRRPQSALEFKQAYASVARAAGLTKDQI